MALLRSLARHQVAAGLATVVDFVVMICTVESGLAGPVLGTGLGAACGAVTNFTLGRHWAFPGASVGARDSQAFRYALVSAGSLALNVLGVYALGVGARAPYTLVRVGVALVVSFGWNFPLHRFFVFGPRPEVT